MNETQPLLTVTDAAPLAEVDRSTVALWCKQGKLPAIMPGMQYLIAPADLEAFLAQPRNRPGQYDRATAKKRQKREDK